MGSLGHHASAMVPWRAAACAFALLADAERPEAPPRAPRVLLSRPRQAAGGAMAAGRLGSYSSVVSDMEKRLPSGKRLHSYGKSQF